MLHQNSGMGSVLTLSSHGLEYRALQGHVPFPRPIVPPPLPPILSRRRGWPAARGMQAGGLAPGGTFQGRPRAWGASLRNSATQLRLGAGDCTTTNSLSFSAPLRVDWLAGVVVASQSPGPETQRAGKGCLWGAERGEPEGREGPPSGKGPSLVLCAESVPGRKQTRAGRRFKISPARPLPSSCWPAAARVRGGGGGDSKGFSTSGASRAGLVPGWAGLLLEDSPHPVKSLLLPSHLPTPTRRGNTLPSRIQSNLQEPLEALATYRGPPLLVSSFRPRFR